MLLRVLILLLLGAAAHAADTNQFLLLTLRHKDGTNSLQRAVVVKGRLKPQAAPEEENSLVCTLEKAPGVALWSTRLAEPAVRIYEYEDPDHPGALKTKTIILNNFDHLVRVPVITGARQLVLSKRAPRVPGLHANSATNETVVTRIDLPVEVQR